MRLRNRRWRPRRRPSASFSPSLCLTEAFHLPAFQDLQSFGILGPRRGRLRRCNIAGRAGRPALALLVRGQLRTHSPRLRRACRRNAFPLARPPAGVSDRRRPGAAGLRHAMKQPRRVRPGFDQPQEPPTDSGRPVGLGSPKLSSVGRAEGAPPCGHIQAV